MKTDEDGESFTEDEYQNTLMAVDESVQQMTGEQKARKWVLAERDVSYIM